MFKASYPSRKEFLILMPENKNTPNTTHYDKQELPV